MIETEIMQGTSFTEVVSKIMYYINSNKLDIQRCQMTITTTLIPGYINEPPKTKYLGALYYDKGGVEQA